MIKQTCPFCGGVAVSINSIKIKETEPPVIVALCANCGGSIEHCGGCVNVEGCLMQLNPDRLSPVVQQRQGNMVMQIPNPELQTHYCIPDKCKCADSEHRCGRQVNECVNWTIHPKILERLTESST